MKNEKRWVSEQPTCSHELSNQPAWPMLLQLCVLVHCELKIRSNDEVREASTSKWTLDPCDSVCSKLTKCAKQSRVSGPLILVILCVLSTSTWPCYPATTKQTP
jgi:hypothetical protein